jgi:hypothetical protein
VKRKLPTKNREAEQKKATKKVELEAAENSKKVALLPELQEDIKKKGVECSAWGVLRCHTTFDIPHHVVAETFFLLRA